MMPPISSIASVMHSDPSSVNTSMASMSTAMSPESGYMHVGTTGTDPTGPFAIASLALDQAEEIVWTGNSNGHISGYYGQSLQKYTAFQVVPVPTFPAGGGEDPASRIFGIEAFGDNVMGVSKSQIRLQYRSGIPKHTIVHDQLQNMQSVLLHDTGMLTLGVGVTDSTSKLCIFDLTTSRVRRTVASDRPDCIVLRENDHFLFCGDSAGKIIVRNKQSLDIVHKFDAHSGPVLDLDVNGPCMVSCGSSMRNGHLSPDRYLMVYDMRMLRTRPPLNMPFEPSFVNFIPTYSDRRLIVASKRGDFQVFEIGEFGNTYQIPSAGFSVTSMRVSTTKQSIVFGDSAGNVHLFSDRMNATFNFESKDTVFADTVAPVPPMSLDDDLAPLSVVQTPFPSAAGQFTDYLSDWPIDMCRVVYREPIPISPAVLDTMRIVQFVGYAAANKVSMLPNQCPYDLNHTGVPLTRTAVPNAAAKLASRSPTGRANDSESRIPKVYRKVHLKGRFVGEELRYESYNRTPHSGIETQSVNGYVNSLLVLMYHLEPLRRIVGSHLCRREHCLACELAFLFQMLDDAGGQQPCLANNFVRALRSMQQADGLGLVLDEQNEAEDSRRRKINDYSMLIQSFARFILQQLTKDLSENSASRTQTRTSTSNAEESSSTSSTASSTGVSPTTGPKVDALNTEFVSTYRTLSTCSKCRTESTRAGSSFMLSLMYPPLPNPAAPVTFESVLAYSLCNEPSSSTFCDKCQDYQNADKKRRVQTLPKVFALDTHIKSDKDIIFWKHHYAYIEHDQKSDADFHHRTSAVVPEMSADVNANPADTGYKASSDTGLYTGPPGGLVAPTRSSKFNQPCRYGVDCARNDCKYLHEHRDDQFEADPTKNHWIPMEFHVTTDDDGVCQVAREKPADEDSVGYQLHSMVYLIKDKRDPHLVAFVRVPTYNHNSIHMSRTVDETTTDGSVSEGDSPVKKPVEGGENEEPSTTTRPSHIWLLFNDIIVHRVNPDQVLHFDTQWKWPCLIFYQRIDANQNHAVDETMLNLTNACAQLDESVFALDECLSMNRRVSSSPFTPLTASELPKRNDLVALDAEFVCLNQEETDGDRDSSALMTVARVTCVRGSGDQKGTPFMDDYITSTAKDEVMNYLTKFSGIQPQDLNPHKSTKHLTTLKSVYLKLRYLINRGVIFVGHGLRSDFRMLNLIVPKGQVRDTVDLFHLPRQRMVSLRFLAWHFLGENIQSETHDSAEDARMALALYEKYLELVQAGKLQEALIDLYEQGKAVQWKVPDKEVDNVDVAENDSK